VLHGNGNGNGGKTLVGLDHGKSELLEGSSKSKEARTAAMSDCHSYAVHYCYVPHVNKTHE
jgi:hypothetical protein